MDSPVAFQSDCGDEFGGDNPKGVAELCHPFLQPLGVRLCRYPLGRKGYNGRVERSHPPENSSGLRKRGSGTGSRPTRMVGMGGGVAVEVAVGARVAVGVTVGAEVAVAGGVALAVTVGAQAERMSELATERPMCVSSFLFSLNTIAVQRSPRHLRRAERSGKPSGGSACWPGHTAQTLLLLPEV
ncbi:MAG: hypothetical protein QXP27_05815 [Candidatus Methanomethyliaceae archaeon]